MALSFDTRLSIKQAARLALVSGANKTYVLQGPMGSGKSSITKLFPADKYRIAVVDCTQLDIGDIQVPDIDRQERVMRMLPNIMLVGDRKVPMVIVFDEIGKASRAVQNACLPVLLEHRVGAEPIPNGSIVIGTTNMSGEGVGDIFQPHMRNRVCFLRTRHPTAAEWIEWGLENYVPAPVLRWAEEHPEIFNTFEDHPKNDNPYIFHPKEQKAAFVTPRSLYLASIELRDEVRLAIGDDDITFAAIAGNIGERAAADLVAYVHLADKLARWTQIVNEPATANVPKDPAALWMQAYKCVMAVEKDTLDAVMIYVQRMAMEMQAYFATSLMRTQKAVWVARNPNFTAWTTKNSWVCRN